MKHAVADPVWASLGQERGDVAVFILEAQQLTGVPAQGMLGTDEMGFVQAFVEMKEGPILRLSPEGFEESALVDGRRLPGQGLGPRHELSCSALQRPRFDHVLFVESRRRGGEPQCRQHQDDAHRAQSCAPDLAAAQAPGGLCPRLECRDPIVRRSDGVRGKPGRPRRSAS